MEPFTLFFDDQPIYSATLPPEGVSTKDVYNVFNEICSPSVVLLFSKFDKPNEIYHKPRLTGGQFRLVTVPVYAHGSSPLDMIQSKVNFKNYKKAKRSHNATVLAERVGRALFLVDAPLFHELAQQVVHSDLTSKDHSFVGSIPETNESWRHIYRYYEVPPTFREAPEVFSLPPEEKAELRFRLQSCRKNGQH